MATLLELLDQEIALIQEGTEFTADIIPCPVIEAPATIVKIDRKNIVSGETTYHLLQIRFEIDSEAAREVVKRDKVFSNLDIFVPLDYENCYNMEAEDANEQVWALKTDESVQLRMLYTWMKSFGWTMPANFVHFWYYLPDHLLGREALVSIKHRLRKTKEEDSEGNPVKVIQDYVANVVALQ